MNASQSPVSAPPLLSVHDLHAQYGQSQVLHGINFDVRAGEVVTLVGRNGAGKTTLLKAIVGLLRQKTGRVELNGQDIARAAPHIIARRGVALVPDDRGIFATLSVRENLELPAVVGTGAWSLEKIHEFFPILAARGHHGG